MIELLPSQLVRVELDGRHQVTAHLGESPCDRNYVRVLVGRPGARWQLMAGRISDTGTDCREVVVPGGPASVRADRSEQAYEGAERR